MECYPCRSISGEKRISPGPFIYEGKYWLVDHAYPTKLKGWLVIVAKRHAEALHELTREEFAELMEIGERTIKLLHDVLQCEKEYFMCLAEKENFHHLHFHVVPRAHDFPAEFIGAKSFGLLRVEEAEAIPKEEIKEFCEGLKNKF